MSDDALFAEHFDAFADNRVFVETNYGIYAYNLEIACNFPCNKLVEIFDNTFSSDTLVTRSDYIQSIEVLAANDRLTGSKERDNFILVMLQNQVRSSAQDHVKHNRIRQTQLVIKALRSELSPINPIHSSYILHGLKSNYHVNSAASLAQHEERVKTVRNHLAFVLRAQIEHTAGDVVDALRNYDHPVGKCAARFIFCVSAVI